MKKLSIILAVGICLALVFSGTALAITNGQPDGDAHPYVGITVALSDEGEPIGWCSAVAVSPTVVVTAAHCVTNMALVSFEEYPVDWENVLLINPVFGFSFAHPEYCLGCANGLKGRDTHDVAVIVLVEPLTLERYAELPEENFVDTLPMNTPVDVVGYGDQFDSGGGPRFPADGFATRYYAQTRLITSNQVNSNEYIKISANPGQDMGGICFGDSGGPDLLGGTDIVLAINTMTNNKNCAGFTYSNRLDTYALSFIQSFIQP